MGAFDSDKTVLAIKNRAKAAGLDLDQYIDKITNTWSVTPMGFGFVLKAGGFQKILTALVANKSFGADSMIGGSQHQGVAYREDNRPDSLHIVVSQRPDPKMQGATCSIHLDSVSVVSGIDQTTGQVQYDLGKVFQHVTSDLKHMPMVLVPGDEGVRFGFRF
jgi:hypothetical protein